MLHKKLLQNLAAQNNIYLLPVSVAPESWYDLAGIPLLQGLLEGYDQCTDLIHGLTGRLDWGGIHFQAQSRRCGPQFLLAVN